MKAITAIAASLMFVAAILGAVFVVGMRSGYPPVLRRVRQMNRAVLNPRALKTAGQPGTWGVVRHVGRTTGTPYETPIGPFPTDDGFIVSLPYGASADWVKNVLAADTAEIAFEGETQTVDHPTLISAEEAFPHLPPKEQKNATFFRIGSFLRLHRVDRADTPAK